jgi:hypothetical protein
MPVESGLLSGAFDSGTEAPFRAGKASPSRLAGNKIPGNRQQELACEAAASEGLTTTKSLCVSLVLAHDSTAARMNTGAETLRWQRPHRVHQGD